jgi:hypothetical protein
MPEVVADLPEFVLLSTCFPDPGSRDLNNLVLIRPGLARARARAFATDRRAFAGDLLETQ